jgi:hypothetical protein
MPLQSVSRFVTPWRTLVCAVAAAGLLSHANVHMGPSSGQEVLVLVPRGTVLAVLGRDNEWIQVRLTPELRKTGMVMRWYKNEDRGWMHDSTVEVLKPGAP